MVRFLLFVSLCVFCKNAFAQEVFAEIFPVKKDVLVGEEFEIRLRLWDSLGLAEIRFMPVDWKNIDVFPDKNTLERVMNKNGKPYQVTQVRLRAVIKTDGAQSFPSLCMSAKVPEEIIQGNVNFGREFSKIETSAYNRVVFSKKIKELKVCSEPFSVTVRKLPDHKPPLFPATDVKFLSGILPRSLVAKVGMPVKRSVVLTAAGTLPGFLPDISSAAPENARTYEGRLERNLLTSGRNLLAGVRKTEVYIPQSEGELVLPEIRADWYNTQTGKIETALLPSAVIKITPAAAAQKTRTAEAEPKKNNNAFFDFERRLNNIFSVFPLPHTMLCVVIFTLAAVFSIFGIARLSRSFRKKRALVADLKEACRAQNPQDIEKALIRWADSISEQTVLNLSDVKRLINGEDEDFLRVLEELNFRLYGRTKFSEILFERAEETIGTEVWKAFENKKPLKKKPAPKKDVFPELYP